MFKINGVTLKTRKNYVFTFLVVSLIFLLSGILFIPLAIYENIRSEIIFNVASVEGIMMFVLFGVGLIFLSLFIVNLVFYNKEKKGNK